MTFVQMKVILILLLLFHGLIHLMGFAKAFNLAQVSQLTQPITRTAGGLWLLASALFLIALGLYVTSRSTWYILAGAAIVVSQVLILLQWKDTKYGTIPNVIILVPVLVAFMASLPNSYYNLFRIAAHERLVQIEDDAVLTDSMLQKLPKPIIKYLWYTGQVGKPIVRNFRAVFSGRMKTSLEGNWVDIHSEQYNFFDDPARLFYVKSSMYGLPFEGLHRYVGSQATMTIKVAALAEVVDARGDKMNQGETVTMLNDMCLLAPATLIDAPILWETIDSLTVKATFTNQGNTISAILYFNQAGALINFVSNDRFLSSDGKTYLQYPWSTPVRDYRNFDGRLVPSYGEAIWLTPDGPFTYSNFYIEALEYNCQSFN